MKAVANGRITCWLAFHQLANQEIQCIFQNSPQLYTVVSIPFTFYMQQYRNNHYYKVTSKHMQIQFRALLHRVGNQHLWKQVQKFTPLDKEFRSRVNQRAGSPAMKAVAIFFRSRFLPANSRRHTCKSPGPVSAHEETMNLLDEMYQRRGHRF